MSRTSLDLESQRLIFEEVKFCREGLDRTKSTEDERVKTQAELCRLCFNDYVLMRDSIMAQANSDYKGFSLFAHSLGNFQSCV